MRKTLSWAKSKLGDPILGAEVTQAEREPAREELERMIGKPVILATYFDSKRNLLWTRKSTDEMRVKVSRLADDEWIFGFNDEGASLTRNRKNFKNPEIVVRIFGNKVEVRLNAYEDPETICTLQIEAGIKSPYVTEPGEDEPFIFGGEARQGQTKKLFECWLQ